MIRDNKTTIQSSEEATLLCIRIGDEENAYKHALEAYKDKTKKK